MGQMPVWQIFCTFAMAKFGIGCDHPQGWLPQEIRNKKENLKF